MLRRNSQTINQVVDQFLDENHLSDRLYEIRLMDMWPQVVGTALAEKTGNLHIEKGILTMHVSSAIVRNELMIMRKSFVNKLNEAVGHRVIRDIVFR